MATSWVLTAGPWAVVAVAFLVLAFLTVVVYAVRSAKTKMRVRIGRFIEIERGEADLPPVDEKPPTQLRPVGDHDEDTRPSSHSG